MNIEIRDSEALKAIRPLETVLYLQSKGWKQVASVPSFSSTWINSPGKEIVEITIPMRETFHDYPLRMGELLQALEKVESRSQLQIYNDLLTITADIVRIRVADPELLDGTIPIEEHAQIAQKARDLILAAACAATEQKAVWRSRKPTQATEHVRRVRIGQSERGSYIITLINRITPLLHTKLGSSVETEDPFERKVTQTLANSLNVLGRATEQTAMTMDISSFEEAVPLGVNANLCDAVVGLWGGDERERILEISFSWSPTRPVTPGTVDRIVFRSDQIAVIREAGRIMREREPFPEFELRGPVVKLERQDGVSTGKVTVVGIVEDRQIRVLVSLEENAYHQAIQAHHQGQTVKVCGTLVKQGRSFILQNPSQFSAEPE